MENRLTLLGMNLVELSLRPSGLYSFKWHEVGCFQIGDPSNDLHVEVRCFDRGDHEFYFLVGARKESESKISQRDINRVLQSLRPAIRPWPQPAATNQPKS
jgi:hypothetical protein